MNLGQVTSSLSYSDVSILLTLLLGIVLELMSETTCIVRGTGDVSQQYWAMVMQLYDETISYTLAFVSKVDNTSQGHLRLLRVGCGGVCL